MTFDNTNSISVTDMIAALSALPADARLLLTYFWRLLL
jgi:hypothetical protein